MSTHPNSESSSQTISANTTPARPHACTIKTEVVIEPKGRILRVSKHYEGRVHDFKASQSEGPLPAVPILAKIKGTF